jgi:hypothetical protein
MRRNNGRQSFWPAIWIGGLVAGTVDVGSACIIYKAPPAIILQAIAGGVLGLATFDEGWWSVTLGLALQWVMSMLIATCCVLASSRNSFLRRRWVVAGCIYGLIILLVMNYVVVPLSASRTTPHFSIPWLIKNTLAMLLFGVIISGVAYRYTGGTAARSE